MCSATLAATQLCVAIVFTTIVCVLAAAAALSHPGHRCLQRAFVPLRLYKLGHKSCSHSVDVALSSCLGQRIAAVLVVLFGCSAVRALPGQLVFGRHSTALHGSFVNQDSG